MSDAAVATVGNFDAHVSAMDAGGGMEGPGSAPTGGLPANDFGGAPPQNDYGTTGRGGAQSLKQSLRDQATQYIAKTPEEMAGEQEAPSAEVEAQEAPETQQGDVPPYEALQEMYHALEQPDLHEGLWEKTVPTTVNGVTVPKTIRELQQGYMRMSDYSRGKQETAQMMRQAQEFMQQGRSTFERLQDPSVLRATLRRLGPAHERSFFQAAQQLAQEYTQYQRATPAERAAMQKAQEMERRAEMAEEAARRAPKEQQRQPHEQYVPHIHQTLQQVVPQTWKRHGLSESPISMRVFAQNIQHVWNGRMETIPEAVERATIATIEILGDQAAQHRQFAQQQQRPQQQALAPRRLPAPAQPPQRGPQKRNEDYRSTKFGDFLKSMGK